MFGRLWIPAFAGMTGAGARKWLKSVQSAPEFAKHTLVSPSREKGFVARCSGLVSSGYHVWKTLDSRLRGNDGGGGAKWLKSVQSAPEFAKHTLVSPSREKGIRWLQFKPDFKWLSCPRLREDDVVGRLWIPAFAGMTGAWGEEMAKSVQLEAQVRQPATCPYKPSTPATTPGSHGTARRASRGPLSAPVPAPFG